MKFNRMNPVLLGYFRLMRPANLPTAAADVLAGITIAGISMDTYYMAVGDVELWPNDLFLCLSSVALYAGGVVLNDVFDHKIDSIERPERPIPRGLVPLRSAALLGVLLLLLGIGLAFVVNDLSGVIAIVLALAILLYDAITKQFSFVGPLNMGLCRGLNLILGMSIAGHVDHYDYALIPVVYIFAVTLISRGEVRAGNKKHLIWAGLLYAVVVFAVFTILPDKPESLLRTAPFFLLFIVLIYSPLINAYKQNTPQNIQKAVIWGVMAIVALDAILASGFFNLWYGLLVILLLPLSRVMARVFAVT
ncbi:MAG: UbiA-like protein EboC [Flavobacteriaceae bacterium]